MTQDKDVILNLQSMLVIRFQSNSKTVIFILIGDVLFLHVLKIICFEEEESETYHVVTIWARTQYELMLILPLPSLSSRMALYFIVNC